MSTSRRSRSAFFLDNVLSEWGNLEQYIIHTQASNRDHRSFLPEKFVQLYKAALENILQDEASTAEEKTTAETLKASDLASNMRAAWNTTKTTPPQEDMPSLKRKSELQSKISEPWMTMMMHVARRARGENPPMLSRTDETLTDNHQMLYEFVYSRLTQTSELSKAAEYELYVALSGIVNARMMNADHHFDSGTLDKIRQECCQEEYRCPDKIPGLTKILDKLKGIPERYISRDGLIDYDGISDEVTLLKAKGIKRKQKREKKEGKKGKMNQETEEDRVWRAVLEVVDYLAKAKPNSSMYEAKVVTIWEHVLYFLSSKALELEARPRGRREEQLPKNLLINHAMVLYLKDHIGLSPEDYDLQALDVNGWRANVFCLKRMGDVFICDLVTSPALELPHSATTWKDFLEGDTIACLCNYVCHLTRVSEDIRRQEAKHKREATAAYHRTRSTGEPKALGEFTCLCPAKSRSSTEASSGDASV
ncbi:MAG: hypothetical protein J3Q66DRAFT_392588 [Benniella sp.]|nr:MAG: hypothetical protein J3Q66DRAFT_392588 [Benniella sp.]